MTALADRIEFCVDMEARDGDVLPAVAKLLLSLASSRETGLNGQERPGINKASRQGVAPTRTALTTTQT